MRITWSRQLTMPSSNNLYKPGMYLISLFTKCCVDVFASETLPTSDEVSDVVSTSLPPLSFPPSLPPPPSPSEKTHKCSSIFSLEPM